MPIRPLCRTHLRWARLLGGPNAWVGLLISIFTSFWLSRDPSIHTGPPQESESFA
ncbi:hypothetical protein JMJ77_0006516 [Colletotrichum scovillei]|uniref:Uncharacterized protein n=1 Tax=Colletotrichum scovillei TaxID=1209932 RepID=A0A9P7RIC7_9PEZI|nr:hypothetical protein JMJ77_0006516 [Colletotrichum scovillei]KAG7077754.1 hypothetical protein JMJ76_0014998 [Colletotrichum scovillei]KAG7084948.1 hypothetical protein JMJ78_0010378 [Colletotrichum scovillei]